MAKEITEIQINIETKDVSIGTKELISGDNYDYSGISEVLSDNDKNAILSILTPYLSA